MKKRFSVFPNSVIKITSRKNLQTIYDQFYQQLILQDSDTRIVFISKDDVKEEYQFEVYKTYVIVRGNMGRSLEGNLTGWGVLTKNGNKVDCEVALKAKSWSALTLLSMLFIFLLTRVYLAVFLDKAGILELLFTALLIIVGYLFFVTTMKRQMRTVIDEIENALK
ncbi:MAG: hypothetical protein K2Q24_15850 [Chitinophagaceae bacterium]|jgi:hypothetical protein|nr:hypothetical protein [Chitinophagaceae bacterium]